MIHMIMKRAIHKRVLLLEDINKQAAVDAAAFIRRENRRYFSDLEAVVRELATGMRDRCLVLLSGPSGSGKGTIIKSLLKQRDDTVLSVSVTTRQPRPGEVDGVHYFFRTREEFERMIEDNALLEWAEYNGNYYGTPEDAIREWLGQGKNVLLEIEVQGAEQVMNHRSDLVSIFITIPSMEELERRLRSGS